MGEEWDLTLYSNRPSGSPMAVLAEKDKPAITVELGGRSSTAPGAFHKVGEVLSRAAMNIMKHYNMIEGTPTYAKKRYKGYQQALLAPESGVFLPEPSTKFHNFMKKGDLIAKIIDYKGKLVYNLEKPDGVKSKLMNINLSKKFGWSAKINLNHGLKKTIHWYKTNK